MNLITILKDSHPSRRKKNLEIIYCGKDKPNRNDMNDKDFKIDGVNHEEACKSIIKKIKSLFENPNIIVKQSVSFLWVVQNQSQQIKMLLSNEFSVKELRFKKNYMWPPFFISWSRKRYYLIEPCYIFGVKILKTVHPKKMTSIIYTFPLAGPKKDHPFFTQLTSLTFLLSPKKKAPRHFLTKDLQNQEENPSLPLDDLKK